MADDYVRPPIVAAELPSRAAATWRFRLVIAVLVLALAALTVFVIRTITGGGEGGATVGSATVGGALPAAVAGIQADPSGSALSG